MNFCALKITKNEILGPKKCKVEKIRAEKFTKIKNLPQKFTKMEKISNFESSVFYEFGPTVHCARTKSDLPLQQKIL